MSQQNLDILRRANTLANTGDWKALFALFDPDVELRDLQHAPDLPEVVRGIEGFRVMAAHWVEAYDDFGVEAYEYIDADPWVVIDVRWYGKGKGSGAPVGVRAADAAEFRDGKIARVVIGYPDVAAA